MESKNTRRGFLTNAAAVFGLNRFSKQELNETPSESLQSSQIPITGDAVPQLQEFDQTMLSFLQEHDIPGGVLGVMRNGDILLERGYGWQDKSLSEPMQPNTLLRIASVSKPFTQAAINTLVRNNRLAYGDSAFSLLDLEPLSGETPDPRLNEITIRNLVNHRGGWDRETAFDPLFQQIRIAQRMDLSHPPNERQIARYMIGKDLQFTPGTRQVYSNFGYLVLGLVIEAVSGMDYQDYLSEVVLRPNSITDFRLGRTLPRDRPARESWYFDPNKCENVMEVDPNELVACPHGGFHLEAMDALGGHIATSRALLKFMDSYWLDGKPRTNANQYWHIFGSLPGTFSLAYQEQSGVNIAVIFNQRGYEADYRVIRDHLKATVKQIDSWPDSIQTDSSDSASASREESEEQTGYTLDATHLCKRLRKHENQHWECMNPDRRNVFGFTETSELKSLVNLSNVYSPLTIRWEWIAPDGSQPYDPSRAEITAGEVPGEWFSYYGTLRFPSPPPRRFFGDWTVRITIENQDNGAVDTHEQSFTYDGGTLTERGYATLERNLCSQVDDSGRCANRRQTFAPGERVYSTMYFTNVIDQLRLMWRWYAPDGQQRGTFEETIPANKIPGDWFVYYSYKDLPPNLASRFFGDWAVETTVVNETTGAQQQYSQRFTVQNR